MIHVGQLGPGVCLPPLPAEGYVAVELPVDSHELIALGAPRPVYIGARFCAVICTSGAWTGGRQG